MPEPLLEAREIVKSFGRVHALRGANFTVFPGEVYQPSRRWAERGYSKLSYFHEVDKGGHFAAWEEPLLFASEMRAGFRSQQADNAA